MKTRIKSVGYLAERLRSALTVRLRFGYRQALGRRALGAYWWKDEVNFGDLLTPMLLRERGCVPVHLPPRWADLVGVGSVLEHVPPDFSGLIFGSGFMHPGPVEVFPRATVLAVRGLLTLARLGMQEGEAALGDPGLMVQRPADACGDPKYALGIVTQHVDLMPRWLRNSALLRDENVSVILPNRDPRIVLREIAACSHVVSSSLHGIIVSDAMEIPVARFGAQGLVGGDFKYEDYCSAIDRSILLPHAFDGTESIAELQSLCSLADPDKVEVRRQGLGQALDALLQNG